MHPKKQRQASRINEKNKINTIFSAVLNLPIAI